MPEQHTAGENIASHCTKCRLVLDHTIVAMVGDRIAKVSCKTCGRTHKYVDPATPKKTPSARAGKAPASETSSAAGWQAALASATGKEQAYDMTAKFKVGDVIAHDRFGKGVVMKVHVRKCDVQFQDQVRLMASGN